MEFKFGVNTLFKEPIVEVRSNLLPPGFSGDRRMLWDVIGKMTEMVNSIGQASAKAQGLTKPITTAERLRNSEHTLYLLIDQNANEGKGAITGMLKTGRKGLYVFDREGQHYQVTPPCVLDFYVHESRQRMGLGKQLFEHMLQREGVQPVKMAIDRPSDKFLGFLNKHYGLREPIKQMNNFVVFDGFFPGGDSKNEMEDSGRNQKAKANGLQNYAMGRYGAPRPVCHMGEIIHNQTSTVQKAPEPAGGEFGRNAGGVSAEAQQQQQQQHQQQQDQYQYQQQQYDHQYQQGQAYAQQYVPQNQNQYQNVQQYEVGGNYQQQQYQVPQAQYQVPQAQSHVSQAQYHVQQAQSQVPQGQSQLSQAQYHVPQVQSQVPQAQYHVPQAQSQVSQAQSQVPQAQYHMPQVQYQVGDQYHQQAVQNQYQQPNQYQTEYMDSNAQAQYQMALNVQYPGQYAGDQNQMQYQNQMSMEPQQQQQQFVPQKESQYQDQMSHVRQAHMQQRYGQMHANTEPTVYPKQRAVSPRKAYSQPQPEAKGPIYTNLRELNRKTAARNSVDRDQDKVTPIGTDCNVLGQPVVCASIHGINGEPAREQPAVVQNMAIRSGLDNVKKGRQKQQQQQEQPQYQVQYSQPQPQPVQYNQAQPQVQYMQQQQPIVQHVQPVVQPQIQTQQIVPQAQNHLRQQQQVMQPQAQVQMGQQYVQQQPQYVPKMQESLPPAPQRVQSRENEAPQVYQQQAVMQPATPVQNQPVVSYDAPQYAQAPLQMYNQGYQPPQPVKQQQPQQPVRYQYVQQPQYPLQQQQGSSDSKLDGAPRPTAVGSYSQPRVGAQYQGAQVPVDFNTHSEGVNIQAGQMAQQVAQKPKPEATGAGDNDMGATDQETYAYGYPPQYPTVFQKSPEPEANGEGASPKLERPRSLSIPLNEEEEKEVEVEPEMTQPEPEQEPEEEPKVVERKTPSHLTDQGFFDLKFYHNKLW